MKVLFNTNKITNFQGAKKSTSSDAAKTEQKNEAQNSLSADDIKRQSKTKIAARCCLACVLGVDILYFAMKRSFNLNKILKEEKKIVKLSNLVAPPKVEKLLKGIDIIR